MRCPVCDELHREHSLACKEEATASLKQRYDVMRQPPTENADPSSLQERQETILSSKKRQLKIVSKLEQHKALAHSA
jgi:hypothetical protein